MDEAIELEVAFQLAIDPRQQVAVERRGDAERVVIGEQQLPLGLEKVGAEEQVVAWVERLSHGPEERLAPRRIEIADVRSQE